MRVLLLGASGEFGSRLAAGLAREPGLELTFAGRGRDALERAAAALRGEVATPLELRVLDRSVLEASALAGYDLVIDAAGPFQDGDTRVAEAAITAGCHYLDLADGRRFVAGIGSLDSAARTAGLVVLSGASTTPALTHATFDALTRDWRRIDCLRAAISPGNRAPKGKAVVAAILSYVGRPVRLFHEGRWGESPGWGLTRRVGFPGIGARLVSLCETPDLDLLVERYRPRVAAEFRAGLELPFLHLALALGGRLVHAGLIGSLLPLAGPMRFGANLLRPLGSDRGGMVAEALGLDGDGRPVRAVWSLAAKGASGPMVPTLPALALTRRLRDGALGWRGAAPCVGHLALADLEPDFARLGIITRAERSRLPAPLFQRALGDRFEALAAVTRRIHRPDPVLLASGRAEVDGAETRLGRRLALGFGFPETAQGVPVTVVIEATAEGDELWVRHYPTRTLRSVMTRADPARGTIEERFGGFAFTLALRPGPGGLDLVPLSGRWRGLPLPKIALPRIAARERAEGERHGFDVTISLPLLGRMVRYRGLLAIDGWP